MNSALLVIQIIISLVLIGAILMQTGKGGGLSGAIAGSHQESSFAKGKNMDGQLGRLTTILASVFMVLALVITIISR